MATGKPTASSKAKRENPMNLKGVKKATKCCSNCQDYVHCDDKGVCCEYCDHYVTGKCFFSHNVKRLEGDVDFIVADYRGDEYGIDEAVALEGFEE